MLTTSEAAVESSRIPLRRSSTGSINVNNLREVFRSRRTSPDLRTRHGIVLVATPNTVGERGISFLVSTGELDSRTGGSISATDNFDLSASGKLCQNPSRTMTDMGKVDLLVIELGLSSVCTMHT